MLFRLLSTAAVIILFSCHSVSSTEFYIAPNGLDSNPGTFEKPFATLQKVQSALRELKTSEGLNDPVHIILKSGVYYLSETLVLEPEDSGSRDAPICWRADEGARVVLSGGRKITNTWIPIGNGVWRVDFPESKGWTSDRSIAETYTAKPRRPWKFRQLFVDGKRAIRARFPNIDSENPFLFASGGSMEHIELDDGLIKKEWGDEPDAQLNIVANWRFFNQWNDVVGINVEKNMIHLGPRERHGKIIKGNWLWIEGVRQELDHPNEWYLDTQEGRLYFVPEQGKNPNEMEFIAPFLNRLIYLKGDVENKTHVEHVHFQGIEFRHTTFTLGQIEARVHTDSAVMFENTVGCRIEECLFENIGGYALWLHLDSRRNVFRRNTVRHSGGGGVLMTGARLSYMDDSKIYTPGENASRVAPYLNEITHNTAAHCGKIRYYGGGVHIDSRPASMVMMPGNLISHNHFYDLSRNGIFAFRNQGGHVIEYNHIHDCMQTTIDGAGIHLASMSHLNAPNYILNNYIYDIWGFEQMADGKPKRHLANGVFLDWDVSHTTVNHNYIYNAGGKAVKTIWNNENLNVENNRSSDKRIVPPFFDEVGVNGSASHEIDLSGLKRTGQVIHYSQKDYVNLTGEWKPKAATGLSGLFEFKYMQSIPGKSASAIYNLPIHEDGIYAVYLCYKPDQKNASNAPLTIHHADGKTRTEWNMKKGNRNGFAVKVGEFHFVPGKPASMEITSEGVDGLVVVDSAALVRIEDSAALHN